MEPEVVVLQKRRGRKRKVIDSQDVSMDSNSRRKTVETRSLKLVGRYVRKEFEDSGLFLGKIIFYESGLYRINYEDGDCEDLNSSEVKTILVEDDNLVGEWSERKEMLDKLLKVEKVSTKALQVEDALQPENMKKVYSSVGSEVNNVVPSANGVVEVHDFLNNEADADSSSDSCEDTQEQDSSFDMEDSLIPPPELPPSSGHIGVPEEYASHLFFVYSFLRSFSVQLFLYPFGLDDFVGALTCSNANTLLDSIHVALLHVLNRHIERLSTDGSELALKCMRCLDWALLDAITWPVYLVHYLMLMNRTSAPDMKLLYTHCLERDYYTLSAGKKLMILQILCDDVLDSEELKAEMDMRLELEVGIDIDTIVTPAGGPRRFHSRYSKTSAMKNIEATQTFAEHHEMNPSLGSHSTQAGEPVGSSVDEDGNGDECRICGMDGLLICCDGCPSSYHTRCLGMNKMHMPEGSWYCPECKINATEPKIMQGTTLKGGQCLGVDPYGQVFVATCDHLLILKASIKFETCLRYYNKHDVPKVLHSLLSKGEHVRTYSEICRGIMQYWELPGFILPCTDMLGIGLHRTNEKGGCECTTHLDTLSRKPVMELIEVDNSASCVTGVSVANMTSSSLTNCIHEPVLSGNSLDMVTKSDQLATTGSTGQHSCSAMKTVLCEPAPFSGLPGQPADTKELSQQSASSATEIASYAERNENTDHNGPVNGPSREAKLSLSYLERSNKVYGKSHQDPCSGFSYRGSFFKTTGYINNYSHGDFAAAAAAYLATLSSEENRVPESYSSYNHRKAMSDNIALQVKAFSSVAMRFFWPNTEKKLFEVPRERCSWCFSCKASVSSKKGCLLNAAASNATRGATKVPAGVRSMKNGDGRLAGIAAYIMFMEESLSGVVGGPFLNDTSRKRWRKIVEQATTCNAIKILLLELEENIRTIALSGDWTKLVDSPVRSATLQIITNAVGSTQKRRPGRPSRKTSAVVEVAIGNCPDLSTDFMWWSGGILSKSMLRRGMLPCSTIRKAARQGGFKKINGIHYVEGLEIPKISRQFIWRSAVEMSRNVAQLALQVRYLDFHVRWSDLVRPEHNPLDGKGLDTESAAFRNAFISDKKSLGHDIRYCVAFGSQKHLPSRVMKNIAEVEKILDDDKERYWFSETRIPLYLIREYEEKVEKNKPVDALSKLQRRQRKGSRKNIFSYLWRKQDDTVKVYCCSCHQDVLHRNAVKCSACQGFCHEQCATSSTVHANEEVEFLITCKRCYETRVIANVQSSYGSPTSPLLLPSQDLPNGVTASKCEKSVAYKQPPPSVGVLGSSSGMKSTNDSASVKKSKNKHWGLIWRKKNCEDDGIDFRLKNILLRGNPDMNLTKPLCRLCNKPYNPNLMYICCQTCQHWYHADALELDESKISLLVGFKCSKCRRIKSPVCPYLDPEKKKTLMEKLESKAPKQDIYNMDNHSCVSSAHVKGQTSALHANAEFRDVAADDPLLSLPETEQRSGMPTVDYEWNHSNVSHFGPQKLPVRRQIKQDYDMYHSDPSDTLEVDIGACYEANTLDATEKLHVRRHVKGENNPHGHSAINPVQVEACNPSEVNSMNIGQDPLPHQAQWVTPDDGNVDDMITLDYDDCLGYDDMEFEPQTYFSFHELLALDDGACANGNESSVPPDDHTLEISYDQEEPLISVGTTIEVVPCKICTKSEPCPDLSCKICGMWLHSHCSPWLESTSWEDGWRCGNCREWR